jgi:hypothetical protein
MPCTDLFDEQPLEYRKSVLLEGVPVMAVEMLCAWGWERYSHVQHGMTSFGMSRMLWPTIPSQWCGPWVDNAPCHWKYSVYTRALSYYGKYCTAKVFCEDSVSQ